MDYPPAAKAWNIGIARTKLPTRSRSVHGSKDKSHKDEAVIFVKLPYASLWLEVRSWLIVHLRAS